MLGSDHEVPGATELLLQMLDASDQESGIALRPTQWDAVERAALRHGLAPLLHRRLGMPGGHPGPPAAVMQRLRDVHLHSMLRSDATRTALGEVLTALRSAGIAVIILKGACLAEDVYGDASLRPMGDVDLLVRPADLERTCTLLRSLGYESSVATPSPGHHHVPAFVKRGAIPLEVHWTPVRRGLATDECDQAWASARPAKIAGVEVLTLVPEALLYHLCLHIAYGHRFRVPLLHLHDLAAVAGRYPALDWDLVEATAAERGTGRFVYAALTLAARAFPSRFPREALPRIARLVHRADDAAVVALVWGALVQPMRDHVRRPLPRSEAAPGLPARARLLSRHRYSSLAELRQRCSDDARTLGWAYLLQLGQLLRRRWRAIPALLSSAGGLSGAYDHVRRRTVLERWACGDDAG